MSLRDEMALYTELSGNDGNHTPIGIIGAYLDGYEKGKASAQPTLYGYQIEHLALIARVMEKEGVTPEKAVQAFVDMKRIIEMAINEIQEKVERVKIEVKHEID